MRVAVTTGVLAVPPTYFVVNHAERLRAVHDFQIFALAADIRDPAITVPVDDFVVPRSLAFATRMALGPLATSAMTRALRSFQPDLVHQHFATWSRSAVTLAKEKVPLITTVHGYDAFLGRNPSVRPFDRYRARQVMAARDASSLVLAVSEYLASEAVATGFDASRLEVHYQGVDTDFFAPAEIVGSTVPTITFVGALTELKGARDAIVASISLASTTEHRLQIIGSGPLQAQLQAAAVAHPHIVFRGGLSRSEVREALQASAVVVMPTQEAGGRREAAGLVLVEAQACGTPVVTYASGGAPEMVRDGVTGRVVLERDVVALRMAISDILGLGSAAYAAMRAAARDFAVRERSLIRSCEQLLAYYDEVI